MLKEIEQILDERVRPQLRFHHGDLKVLSFSEGILRFRLLGQCADCPSAYLTVEQLIQVELTSSLPQVKEVILIQQVDDSLLNQARAILSHSGVAE